MKKLALILSCLIVVGACAPIDPIVTRENCQTASNITINVQSTNPRATPDNRCASPGETFTIRVRPTGQTTNTVQLVAKTNNPDGGGPNNWLTKVNSTNGDEIQITVPNTGYFENICDLSADDCQFRYAIFVNGKNPVDPRVTVQD